MDARRGARRGRGPLLGFRYDPAYVKLRYPGGDVPPDRGVCTDVVIRAYRALAHTGVVVDRKDPTGTRPLIVHNIGGGPKLEGAPFSFRIIGHFRDEPAAARGS